MVGRTRLAFKVSAILDRNGEPSGAAKAGVSHGLMRLTLQRELLVGRTGRSQEPRPPRSPSLVAPSEGVGMVDPTLVDEIWGNGGLEHDHGAMTTAYALLGALFLFISLIGSDVQNGAAGAGSATGGSDTQKEFEEPVSARENCQVG